MKLLHFFVVLFVFYSKDDIIVTDIELYRV